MYNMYRCAVADRKRTTSWCWDYISSSVFLTHSLTFLLNAGRSSRHMIDASMFAAESQFGSLNIDKTERRIVSRTSRIDEQRERRSEPFTNGLHRWPTFRGAFVTELINTRFMKLEESRRDFSERQSSSSFTHDWNANIAVLLDIRMPNLWDEFLDEEESSPLRSIRDGNWPFSVVLSDNLWESRDALWRILLNNRRGSLIFSRRVIYLRRTCRTVQREWHSRHRHWIHRSDQHWCLRQDADWILSIVSSEVTPNHPWWRRERNSSKTSRTRSSLDNSF